MWYTRGRVCRLFDYAFSDSIGESILGGLLDFIPGPGDLLSLYVHLVSFWEILLARIDVDVSQEQITYDLRLSPSRLLSSMILNISFLPSLASIFFPPILILTFSFVLTINSLLSNKCFIIRHTYTPQSLPFSCCGVSFRLINRMRGPRRRLSFSVTIAALSRFWLLRES